MATFDITCETQIFRAYLVEADSEEEAVDEITGHIENDLMSTVYPRPDRPDWITGWEHFNTARIYPTGGDDPTRATPRPQPDAATTGRSPGQHVWHVHVSQYSGSAGDGTMTVGVWTSEVDARIGFANWIVANNNIGIDEEEWDDFVAAATTDQIIAAYEEFWNEDIVAIEQLDIEPAPTPAYGKGYPA